MRPASTYAHSSGGLRWQATNPQEAANWQIVSLGEAFPPEFAYPLQNFSVRGKVSLQEYSALLSRASIGISLMISPHPSYPPLEMAMAGLLTITNRFEEKDLSVYSDSIINLDTISPEDIATRIEQAVTAVSHRAPGVHPLPGLNGQPDAGTPVDYDAVADAIHSASGLETQGRGDFILPPSVSPGLPAPRRKPRRLS